MSVITSYFMSLAIQSNQLQQMESESLHRDSILTLDKVKLYSKLVDLSSIYKSIFAKWRPLIPAVDFSQFKITCFALTSTMEDALIHQGGQITTGSSN